MSRPAEKKRIDELPPPVLVEDQAGLERMCAELARHAEVAVDTEADSFYRYQERVCLIQVSVEGHDYLVDTLAGFDVAPLGDLLADPDRVKVFHDGEYDVLIMKRQYGFRFANLFDTRVAAAALGEDAPGLASVVRERFGVELDKSLQRSDWSSRPLTPRQIAYARLDTRFLIELMHVQRAELAERGREMIVAGECERLEALEPPERAFHPDEFIRLKGARQLAPLQMQVLRELFLLRDRMARERDLPPFKVMGNGALLALARSRVDSLAGLGSVEGLSPRVARRIGREILGAIRKARKRGPLKKVPRPPARDGTQVLDEVEGELHDRLKTWRKKEAAESGIDASLILNRHVLLRLAKARPRSLEKLRAVEGLLPWQVELFGEALLALVEASEAAARAGRLPDRRRRPRRR